MLIELVVFDCEGTLLRANRARARSFAGIGSTKHDGMKLSCSCRKSLSGIPGAAENINSFGEFSYSEQERSANDLLLPGALETLSYWHERLALYAVSDSPSETLRTRLATQGLDIFFRGIYGSPPSKVELLRQAVCSSKACGLTTVMVGNSQADYDAAETAGTYFYGIGPAMEHCRRVEPWAWGKDLSAFNCWLDEFISKG